MHGFEYVAPESLEEVFVLLERHGEDARLIAGGTALVILMKQRLVQPAVLVSLARVPGLKGIDEDSATGAPLPVSPRPAVRIGALTTHYEAETSPLVRDRLPVLADTLHHVATVRVRNFGTIGGNLAHADPNQDPPVTLIALGASVELTSAAGTRTVALEDFFTDYYETVIGQAEVLTAIHVPGDPFGRNVNGAADEASPAPVSVYRKFLPRTADDYATVAVAATVRLDGAGQRCVDVRVALGAVGSTPIRARQVENLLRGQAFDQGAIRAAAAAVQHEVDPVTDVRGSADYKRDMAEVWVRRALMSLQTTATARVQ
jgi:carbon-monoxide dehydrogenase medium subunit